MWRSHRSARGGAPAASALIGAAIYLSALVRWMTHCRSSALQRAPQRFARCDAVRHVHPKATFRSAFRRRSSWDQNRFDVAVVLTSMPLVAVARFLKTRTKLAVAEPRPRRRSARVNEALICGFLNETRVQ